MARAAVSYLLVAVAAAALTAMLIYLTPLRYTRFIPSSIHEVKAQDFYADYKRHPDRYLFIDVRPASSYQQEHAIGAVSIPLPSLYDLWHTFPHGGKTIALICGSNESSGVAYGYLEDRGFTNLIRITDGMPAWIAAGLPVEGTNVHKSATTTAMAPCPVA